MRQCRMGVSCDHYISQIAFDILVQEPNNKSSRGSFYYDFYQIEFAVEIKNFISIIDKLNPWSGPVLIQGYSILKLTVRNF